MRGGPGHNGGPTMEQGAGWRRYAWARARADLMPVLPLEVARRRVRRAQELGLDYRAYAGIRAGTGRDIVALLFSTNALRLLHQAQVLPPDRAQRLAAIRGAERLAAVQPPLNPEALLLAHDVLDRAARAPGLTSGWSETGAILRQVLGRTPGDAVLLIGDTMLERDWVAPARLAGYLPADRYFGPV